jgi:nucleotide-binding universal stress UspA family protein
MLALQHILCPVDLSGASAQALRYAVALRGLFDSSLTILAVRGTSLHARHSNTAAEDRTLESFVSAVASAVPRMPLLQRAGRDPAAEILAASATMNADLIVMRTHGHTGVERLLLSSVSERDSICAFRQRSRRGEPAGSLCW